MTRIVLLGAGHAHVEVLRRAALRPLPGVRLVLVSDTARPAYSGMLPGLIRGECRLEAAHLDAAALARAAGADYLAGRARALDPAGGQVDVAGQGAVAFDLISVNVGGAPVAPSGGVGVKPVAGLLAAIAAQDAAMPARVAVVGAGAGGCELALALAARWRGRAALSLIGQDPLLLPGAPDAVRRVVAQALAAAGVGVRLGARAMQHAGPALRLADGAALPCDLALWATGVAAPGFLAAAGLDCDARGAVRVDAGLRSRSHAHVFAAGDCAALPGAGVPQSGVWAVRAGPVLAENLRRAAAGLPPRPWQPQRTALAILGLGDGRAVAWRAGVTVSGRWVMRWKDRIDRRWMARYHIADQGD